MNEPSLIDQRYLRKELIGKGGMGRVYRAYDTIVQRDVAIKFLKSTSLADSNRRDRFKREIKLLAQHSNSYIVPLYGYGNLDQDDHNNPPFIVMQLMNKSLDQFLIENKSVDFPVVVYILERVGLAADFIHARQIVHRDIKPENIFLDAEKFCYLGDFGIALQADEFSFTENGPIGSAHYMSPEQVLGKELDGTSDIYSLGGLLYTLLTGKRPFAELGSGHEIKQAHLAADRPVVTFEQNQLFAQINPILRQAMGSFIWK